jgi:hypothetical protein
MFHHSDALINHLLHGNIIGSATSLQHEHKISSIIYLVNRLNTYPIFKEAKDTQLNTTKTHYITTNVILTKLYYTQPHKNKNKLLT